MRISHRGLAIVLAVAGVAACGGEGAKSPANETGKGSEAGAGNETSKTGTSSAGIPADMSLEDKEGWIQYQQWAKDWADATNTKCSTKISGTWDVASYKGTKLEDRWTSQACESAFTAVQDICGQGDLQKQTVTKKIQKIECKKSASKGSKVELTGGVLNIHIDPKETTPPSNSWSSDIKGKL